MSQRFDRLIPHLIFGVTTFLVLFGLVMVYSSVAFKDYKDLSRGKWERAIRQAVEDATLTAANPVSRDIPIGPLEELHRQGAARRASMLSTFLRQGIWVLLGFAALTLASLIDYPLLGKKIGWIVLVTLGLQAALFLLPTEGNFPVRAHEYNGATSWLKFFSFTIQPSEVAKLGLVVFLAWFLSQRVQKGGLTVASMLPVLPILAVSIGMILMESDRGVAAHLCLSLVLLWMAAGGRIVHLVTLSFLSLAGLGGMIATSENALLRLIRFINGEPVLQIRQSLRAFSRGGLFGTGLGDSDEALTLYAAHNDFILAVVGEELGFVATSLVVAGYCFLVLLGLRVAAGCSDPFGKILAMGLTLLLGTQAFLNMAVVTGMAPPTGFTLPLMSYGGSSLVVAMTMIGILINASLSTHGQLLGDRKRVKIGRFSGREVLA